MDSPQTTPQTPGGEPISRRTFSGRVAACAMAGGLVAGYGGMALVAGRYLYPARPQARRWMFVSTVAGIQPGGSIPYKAPNGAKVNVARIGTSGTAADFIALSSTCPHLGCQVSWEPQNSRFFCPCHNGIFNASGKGIGGPPGEAGQNLPRYPLKVEEGLLLIEVPVETTLGAVPTPPSATEGLACRITPGPAADGATPTA